MLNNYHKSKLIFGLLLLCLMLCFFRENYRHGMQGDEVYRINSLVPLMLDDVIPNDQSVYSINIFGKKIPVQYKAYVSSLAILPYAHVFLFENNFLAHRLTQQVYYFLSIFVLFLGLRLSLIHI